MIRDDDVHVTTFAESGDYFQSFGKRCQIIRRVEFLEVWYLDVVEQHCIKLQLVPINVWNDL